MPSVNVSFLGVCTLFPDLRAVLPPGVSGPKHRAVLVRNTPFMKEISGIHPHIPMIQFDADHVVQDGPNLPPPGRPEKHPHTYGLDGVTITVVNPASNSSPLLSLGCLPSLQGHLDPGMALGPPAPLVYEHHPERAAAWFDTDVLQTWEGFRMSTTLNCKKVPAISILAIETTDSPEVLVTPWAPGSVPTKFTVSNDDGRTPGVLIMNFADGSGVVDSDRDFFLNYLCAANFPISSARLPTEHEICVKPSPIVYHIGDECGDAGPGCSNTDYP